MRFARYLALILLVGLSLSFQGRLDPDFDSPYSSSAYHVGDQAQDHTDSSHAPLVPQGDHKDQHGCYHSHAPFLVPTSTFDWQPASAIFATALLKIPYFLAPTSILHPPRA